MSRSIPTYKKKIYRGEGVQRSGSIRSRIKNKLNEEVEGKD